MATHIGIDNGVSGAIGILSPDLALYPTPTHKTLNYQKDGQHITRIDVPALRDLLDPLSTSARVILERPLVNPGRFTATASALRAFEATLIVLEELRLSYSVVDSRIWQRLYLPAGLRGPALKAASLEVGLVRWPLLAPAIRKQGDADALFLAQLGLEGRV